MAFRQSPLPQGRQHRRGVAENPQFVGDGALALAQEPGGLLLTHGPVFHEHGDAPGFFHKVQILPLEIFHHGGHAGFLVGHVHHDAGDLGKPRHLRRPEPPLPGNELVGIPHPPHRQGLEHPMLADGFGQLLQCLLPEDFPRLGGVGADGTGRQEHHPAGLHIGFQLLALHGHSSFVLVLSFYPQSYGKTHENQRRKRGNYSPQSGKKNTKKECHCEEGGAATRRGNLLLNFP